MTAEPDEITAYDRTAFGADRRASLRLLIADAAHPPVTARNGAGPLTGYALSRPGARADSVGPLAADDPAATRTLLTPALTTLHGRSAFLDVNPMFPAAGGLATAAGFAPQRELVRMRLGPGPSVRYSGRIFLFGGPEAG